MHHAQVILDVHVQKMIKFLQAIFKESHVMVGQMDMDGYTDRQDHVQYFPLVGLEGE